MTTLTLRIGETLSEDHQVEAHSGQGKLVFGGVTLEADREAVLLDGFRTPQELDELGIVGAGTVDHAGTLRHIVQSVGWFVSCNGRDREKSGKLASVALHKCCS